MTTELTSDPASDSPDVDPSDERYRRYLGRGLVSMSCGTILILCCCDSRDDRCADNCALRSVIIFSCSAARSAMSCSCNFKCSFRVSAASSSSAWTFFVEVTVLRDCCCSLCVCWKRLIVPSALSCRFMKAAGENSSGRPCGNSASSTSSCDNPSTSSGDAGAMVLFLKMLNLDMVDAAEPDGLG